MYNYTVYLYNVYFVYCHFVTANVSKQHGTQAKTGAKAVDDLYHLNGTF